jgi:hypothetical protein
MVARRPCQTYMWATGQSAAQSLLLSAHMWQRKHTLKTRLHTFETLKRQREGKLRAPVDVF